VIFASTEAAAVFKGTVTAEITQFASISGGFAVSKDGSKLTIAAAGVTAFVGTGNLGVRVTDGKLGVVVKTDTKKFAAVASGTAALEGVDGLTVTGTGSVRINKLGTSINETITTPSGDVTVKFDNGTEICRSVGRSTCSSRISFMPLAIFCLKRLKVVILPRLPLPPVISMRSLGVNYGVTGEFGVKVTAAGVAMLIEKQGSNAAKYAISTTGGTAGLVGLSGVDLTGPLCAEHQQTRPHHRHQYPRPQRRDLPAELYGP
jgi:hypothetical protein